MCKRCEELMIEIDKLKHRNEVLLMALISIANDEIKKAENGIKYIKDRKEMTEDELKGYYNKKIVTWKQRKKSYLFQK